MLQVSAFFCKKQNDISAKCIKISGENIKKQQKYNNVLTFENIISIIIT